MPEVQLRHVDTAEPRPALAATGEPQSEQHASASGPGGTIAAQSGD